MVDRVCGRTLAPLRLILSVTLLLAGSSNATGQYVWTPFSPATPDSARPEPELAAIAADLKDRFNAKIERPYRESLKDDQSFLLATLTESKYAMIDTGDAADDVVALQVLLVVRPRDADSGCHQHRVLRYREEYRPPPGQSFSFIAEGMPPKLALSKAAPRVQGHEGPVSQIDVDDSWSANWSAVLFDGKHEYYWAGNRDQLPLRHKGAGEDAELGVPSLPFTTLAQLGLRQQPRDEMYSPYATPFPGGFMPGYLYFLDFAANGLLPDGYEVHYERDEASNILSAEFSAPMPLSDDALEHWNYGNLRWRVESASGLPIAYEQDYEQKGREGQLSILSHRWRHDKFVTGDGNTIYFPSAWDELRARPWPRRPIAAERGEDGTVTVTYAEPGMGVATVRTLLLRAEFNETSHCDHPALRPETLAGWLGVSLAWTMPDGTRIQSDPPSAVSNIGAPDCALLKEIRSELDRGRIKIDWPWPPEPSNIE